MIDFACGVWLVWREPYLSYITVVFAVWQQNNAEKSKCWSFISLYRSSHSYTLKVRVHCYGYSCVYNSCRAGCNVDDLRLTGDALSQADSAVSNSVGLCYRYWRRPCYRIHTRQLFVCGLASFDCIMYSRTSDKPLEIASNGTGQSNKQPVIWYWSSEEMSGVLFVLSLFLLLTLLFPQYFTIFSLLVFFPLNTSPHFLPELPTDIEAHTALLTNANRNISENMNQQFVWF